jgi:hypothetical protein
VSQGFGTPPPSAPSGSGLPDGGTTGQVLAKASNTDGDAEWITGGDAPADASTISKGIVQLAGDLTGTADSPQIAAGAVGATEIAGALKGGAAAGSEALRALGTTATTAAAGNDSRLSDSRTPAGAAGGVLGGSYPNPTFAADMATQAELDAAIAAKTSGHTVQDEGSALTQRAALNFVGAGVQVTDDAGNGATKVTVSGQLYSAVTVTPESYGAKRDGRMITDAAITTGTATLTSASGPFTSADVGKAIHIRNAAAGTNVGLTTTISAYISATQVTLAANAGATVSGQVAVYGSDDTAAWAAAVAAAVAACQANRSYYAEIVGSNGIYMIAGAATLGGGSPDTRGNAQIPLPVVPPGTGQKVILRLGGAHFSAGQAHWDQTQPQMSGCVLFSTLVAQTSHGTYGVPAVIGGPTIDLTSPTETFSNMRLIIDGLSVILPFNPTFTGIDARRLAQCDVLSLTVQALATPDADGGTPNFATKPTAANGVGLYLSRMNNNDSNNVGVYHCSGFYYGLGFSDHLTAQKLLLLYCDTAMWINNVSGTPQHGSWIGYASVEACNRVIDNASSSSGSYPLVIDQLDVEIITGPYDINDTNNSLRGHIGFVDPPGKRAPRVNGARYIRVEDLMPKRGGPAVLYPTSGITAITNAIGAQVTTSTAHGLTTGQRVQISGVAGATGANGIWTVTLVDTTHFTIDNAGAPGAYTSGGLVETLVPLPKSGGGTTAITGISQAAAAVVTAAGHGLTSGQLVTITGLSGPQANLTNGTFPVIVLDANTFSIPVNTTTAAYSSGGGTVNHAYVPWRDAMAYITGGTVTAIAVDGVATGLTSGGVVVPAGKKLEITYSVAPTLTVTLL